MASARPEFRFDAKLAGGGQGHLQVTHSAAMMFYLAPGLRADIVTAFMNNLDTQVDVCDARAMAAGDRDRDPMGFGDRPDEHSQAACKEEDKQDGSERPRTYIGQNVFDTRHALLSHGAPDIGSHDLQRNKEIVFELSPLKDVVEPPFQCVTSIHPAIEQQAFHAEIPETIDVALKRLRQHLVGRHTYREQGGHHAPQRSTAHGPYLQPFLLDRGKSAGKGGKSAPATVEKQGEGLFIRRMVVFHG